MTLLWPPWRSPGSRTLRLAGLVLQGVIQGDGTEGELPYQLAQLDGEVHRVVVPDRARCRGCDPWRRSKSAAGCLAAPAGGVLVTICIAPTCRIDREHVAH